MAVSEIMIASIPLSWTVEDTMVAQFETKRNEQSARQDENI
jgi:hypothetical protein